MPPSPPTILNFLFPLSYPMMPARFLLPLAFGALLAVLGCDLVSKKDEGDPPRQPPTDSLPDTSAFVPAPGDELGCAQACRHCGDADRAALFQRDSLPVFDLTLPAERWQHLQDHALDEEYEQACVSVDDIPIGTVGLRFKGAYGTLIPCVDRETGAITCDKLSLKLKFSEVYPDLRFHGMKRLNLHSMKNDPTKLREKIGYDLYRAMGVQAPLSDWAMVRINGEPFGIYSMVEEIDGRFTDDRWPEDGDGNLWKETWPLSDRADDYIRKLETNEEKGTPAALLDFHAELTDASPAARFDVLGKWMDTDYLHRYMAVDDAIVNSDGSTAFYTSSTAENAGNHNFYLYQEEKRRRFWKIPWDLDATFQFYGGWGSVPHWTQTPEDCAELYPVWSGVSTVAAPGCDRVFQALASQPESYRRAIDTLLAGPFSEAEIYAHIDQWQARIDHAVRADSLSDYSGWRNAVDGMKALIPLLRQRLQAFRENQPVIPWTLKVSSPNDFEDATDAGLQLGIGLIHNSASTVTQAVSDVEPLEGTQDARIDFVFRDGTQPWDHWIFWSLPFDGGTRDLSGYDSLRFQARANRNRSLRVELTSPEITNASLGVYPGWDILLSTAPRTYTVALSAAKVPDWAGQQGIDPGDSLAAILSTSTGIAMNPKPVGQKSGGFLGDGIVDSGFVHIDNIEFISVTAP